MTNQIVVTGGRPNGSGVPRACAVRGRWKAAHSGGHSEEHLHQSGHPYSRLQVRARPTPEGLMRGSTVPATPELQPAFGCFCDACAQYCATQIASARSSKCGKPDNKRGPRERALRAVPPHGRRSGRPPSGPGPSGPLSRRSARHPGDFAEAPPEGPQ